MKVAINGYDMCFVVRDEVEVENLEAAEFPAPWIEDVPDGLNDAEACEYALRQWHERVSG